MCVTPFSEDGLNEKSNNYKWSKWNVACEYRVALSSANKFATKHYIDWLECFLAQKLRCETHIHLIALALFHYLLMRSHSFYAAAADVSACVSVRRINFTISIFIYSYTQNLLISKCICDASNADRDRRMLVHSVFPFVACFLMSSCMYF